MSTKVEIQVEDREVAGTAACRRLRRAGHIPAVVYGHGKPAVPIVVPEEAAREMVRHPGLIALKMSGNHTSISVVLKDVQLHPVSRGILHLDLQEVKADEVISAVVRIEAYGVPAGRQHGGQLQQILHELEIRCLPGALFEVLTVDVAGLGVDDTLHVRDLTLPEGVTPATDVGLPVFQVRLPRAEEAEPDAEVAAEAEKSTEQPAAEGGDAAKSRAGSQKGKE